MWCLPWLKRKAAEAEVAAEGYQALDGHSRDSLDRGRWCPEETANPVSRVFFSFANGLVRKGTQKTLEPNDLWDLEKKDEARSAFSRFQSNLEATKTAADPCGRLGSALFRTYGKAFATAGVLKLFHDTLMFLGPVILRMLLRSLDKDESWSYTFALAVAMLVASTCQTLLVNQYFNILFRIGLQSKVASIHVVYDKLLRLSNASKADMGNGAITNLQSNDTSKIWNIPQYLHMLWSGPFQIIVVMAMLINVMNLWPAVAGFVVTVALIPLNMIIGRFLGRIRRTLVGKTDARIKLCTEVIMGIKAIKLYAWEDAYRSRIIDLREIELKQILKSALLGSFYSMIFIAGPILVSLASFGVYSYLGYRLTADIAFPALALFNLLRFPIMMLPMQIMNMINGAVALRRLQAFLCRNEKDPLPALPPASTGEPAITVRSADFAWSQQEDAPLVLKSIDFEVRAGELVMVVGEVGSGKSSLLAAILREMLQVKGSVEVKGDIAFTSQDSWIQNATLRDNILMGRPFDAAYYEHTLDVCALRADLEQLAAGDETEIGEKGINLSGGQRARVALARAVYSRADVYLLDDPLSAVDAHVGAHLFQECISGALQKTARLLVTHQLQFLPMADKIIVMEGGSVSAQGSFDELQQRGINFQELALAAPKATEEEGGAAKPKPEAEARPPPLPTSVGAPQRDEDEDQGDGADQRDGEGASHQQGEAAENGERSALLNGQDERRKKGKGQGRLVMDEHRSRGQVKRLVYMRYLLAWGPLCILPGLFTLFVHAERVLQVLQNFWLSVWSQATSTSADAQNSYYMAVYFGLGAASLVFALARTIILTYGANNAARQLHHRLLHTILRLPMSFFDTQPTGRLLNRFTKDTEAVDVQLSGSISSFAMCFTMVWMSLVVVIIVTPVFILGVIPIGFIYLRLQKVFISTSRELKRLDSIAFSPIFSHFSETLSGLTTVRAFRCQDMFNTKNHNLLDACNRCWWPIQVVNRWLSVRLELIGIAISFGTAIFVAVVLPTNGGLAGLALTSALNLTGLMTWLVRQSTELEVNMNSVERLMEYDTVEPEAAAVVEDARPPGNWPTRGRIVVRQLEVRYRSDLPPVLKGISFDVREAEKIGIAGRTGCGKSTLMMTMFRIVEPCGGSLEIDGVDVLRIGLRDLRSRLALVPQDPVIFSGTVRSNLDPFDEHADNEIWEALSKVSMDEVVRGMSGGLFSPIEEGGQNLSVGQRQLLGMARALVRSARILILDEATSNVDTSTDLLIQKTIREAFAHCSVLTIAHRLHTIMKADRIMVLDDGNISEFAAPAELLENPDGMFSKLVEEASKQQGGNMKASASEAQMAEMIRAEAERVRRLSLERKAPGSN